MESKNLLSKYTILPSYVALPHLGFTNGIVECYHKVLKLSGGFQPNGRHISMRSLSNVSQESLHMDVMLLQLDCSLMTTISLSSIQPWESRHLFFLDTVIG